MLARVELDDVAEGVQGVGRRLPMAAILRLDLAVALGGLGTPSATAVRAAGALRSGRAVALRPYLALTYDATAHEAELADRVRDAAERVITRRRGRPTHRRA